MKYEGEEFGYYDTYPFLETDNELTEKINYAFSQLTEVQKRRLLMLASGMSIREIAQNEKVHHSTVEDSIKLALKKFKKFF